MPMLAMVAVALCITMVLVVWSVMGGFLTTLLNTGRVMTGDVAIHWPNSGFPHYAELQKMLEADQSKVAATTAMVETFGLISLPDDRVEAIQIKGIEPLSYAKVVEYERSLWWKPIERPVRRDVKGTDPRLEKDAATSTLLAELLVAGQTMREPDPITGVAVEAAVPGIEVMGLSRRQPEGYYKPEGLVRTTPQGSEGVFTFAPQGQITLRMVPLDAKGRVADLVSWTLPVANEFRTEVYEIDRRTVFVPLYRLKLSQGGRLEKPVDPYGEETPAATKIDPPRVNTVLVRGVEGLDPDALRVYCTQVYAQFAQKYAGQVPALNELAGESRQLIRTWRMQSATLIGAVEKETGLVLMLLWLISLVSSFLVLAIFWAMISEKTKDIGILRAMGASASGIAWLWIRYGLIIGVVGSLVGIGLASLIVTNINEIHEALGKHLGVSVWDPKVYYFSEIPSKLESHRIVIVAASGIFFSTLGAIIPAIRAARMDPVKALRFE
jgi:lipoprotein-releasing system permease protein